MPLRASLLICAALLLSACAHKLDRQTCMALAQGVDYCLAPLPDSAPVSQSQLVKLKVKQARHQLLSQLDLTPESLTLVGLAPLGQPLFTLSYDGQRLISEQSVLLGDQFKAEYLLGLLQLIYWQPEDVNHHLQGATLADYACDAAHCRRLYASDGETIMDIRYSRTSPWTAEVTLDFHQAQLTLNIQPLE
ncbi:DUF3261 domain-containing protein [Shewanella rhizosphaerae]|uniref:DUF3261 domain-containing protein n=1 Tax=Shewanella rhizosphaerae TaxID=2864207 RepID=UPI001C6608D1|nr:DUF3261 domain-containing protein [Shewanella rhizosphaerae]QYK12632.1 DUF3261 domain-containing protein [Shewanella rhizosphaerae]